MPSLRVDAIAKKNATACRERTSHASVVSRSFIVHEVVVHFADQDRGIGCDLAGRVGQGRQIIISEFFSIKNEAPPRNKVPIRQIPSNGSSRFGDRREKVTPTKIILVLLLLASAITAAFANPPGGSYIQCDPKNPRSPVRCTPDGW